MLDISSNKTIGGIFSPKITKSQKDKSEASIMNPTFIKYSYNLLKNEYFGIRGVGITVNGGLWSEIKEIKQTGVIFIDGNLTIDTNIGTLNPNTADFLMLIVNGNISIDQSVAFVNAILLGKDIEAGGVSENQLVINGMIYSTRDIKLTRSFEPKKENNLKPSVKINYNPKLLFEIPIEMTKKLSQWKVN